MTTKPKRLQKEVFKQGNWGCIKCGKPYKRFSWFKKHFEKEHEK